MPRQRQQRLGQLAGYWLSKRPNSPQWCRTWFDPDTRQTRRASLGTDDLAAAERALAEWITRNVAPQRAEPAEITVARAFARYFERHGQHVIGADAQRRSLAQMLKHLPEGITVGELTRDAQEACVRTMRGTGYNAWTIKRAFGAGKAAINWAWQNGELDRPIPFIKLPEGNDRERVLTVPELARLWDQEMPDHVRAFLAVVIGTGARPEAALQLTRFQCDLDARTVNLNPPGRIQTKKRRPVLPLPDWLRPWVEAAEGHLVAYRGKPVKKIAGAFQTMRDAAGFGFDVTAYTVRHTIGTMLLKRGVDLAQIEVLLGHKLPGSRTTRRYIHVGAEYLASACAALDAIANDIGRAATRPMLPTNVRASSVLVTLRKGGNPARKVPENGAAVGTGE